MSSNSPLRFVFIFSPGIAESIQTHQHHLFLIPNLKNQLTVCNLNYKMPMYTLTKSNVNIASLPGNSGLSF